MSFPEVSRRQPINELFSMKAKRMAITMALPQELTLGEKFVQEEFLGEEFLGKKYMGDESLGEKYMGVRRVSGYG